jgi:hypothetical protein
MPAQRGFPSLAALAMSHQVTRERAPQRVADLPTSIPQAEAVADPLRLTLSGLGGSRSQAWLGRTPGGPVSWPPAASDWAARSKTWTACSTDSPLVSGRNR